MPSNAERTIPTHGFLHVVVHSGRDLPAADFGIMKETSDPYVILSFGDQTKKTSVKDKTLDPKWGEAFTFQVGSFTRVGSFDIAQLMSKQRTKDESTLLIDVWDKDLWSDDDPLGAALLKLDTVYSHPGVWCRRSVKLTPPKGSDKSGSIQLMLLFQKEHAVPSYFFRLCPAVGYFVSGAMMLISSRCRWQHEDETSDLLMQPGVGFCMIFAALLAWVAGVIEFLSLHAGLSFDHRMLSKSSVASGLDQSLKKLHKILPAEEASAKHNEESLVMIKARPNSLSEYEIDVTIGRINIQLPTIVVLALLPHGSEALGALGLILQLQDWSLALEPGELIAASAVLLELVSAYADVLLAFFIEPSAQATKSERQISRLPSNKDKLRETMHERRAGLMEHHLGDEDDEESFEDMRSNTADPGGDLSQDEETLAQPQPQPQPQTVGRWIGVGWVLGMVGHRPNADRSLEQPLLPTDGEEA